MPCETCLPRLRRLKFRPRAKAVLDPETDAYVWADERVKLCAGCARIYRVILNVRTQLWFDERPSLDFQMVWDRFREECPFWIGFRREKPAPARPPSSGFAIDEVFDED
jgi:hypothetical protein